MSSAGDWETVDDTDAYLKRVRQEVSLLRMISRPVVLTWWLLGVNVVFWLAARYHGIGLADDGLAGPYFNAEQISFFTGMKVNEAMADGQWWRLFSSQFVHLDILHLIFNGYGILVLGRFLERCYGIRRILVLYLASGAVGAYASFLTNPTPAGGASGAVYGLVGAAVIFGFKYRDALPSQVSKALTIGLVPWIILSLGIGFVDAIPMDNAAHIGGLITGAAIAWVMASRLRQQQGGWTEKVVWVFTAVAIAALLWMGWGWSAEVMDCLPDVDSYALCYPELYGEIQRAADGL